MLRKKLGIDILRKLLLQREALHRVDRSGREGREVDAAVRALLAVSNQRRKVVD